MSSCHSQLTVHSHTRHHWACTSHQHNLPGMAPGRGAGGPRSLQRARLFRAIVSLPPGGQVALSSAPVSHDSRETLPVPRWWGGQPCPDCAAVGLCSPTPVSR